MKTEKVLSQDRKHLMTIALDGSVIAMEPAPPHSPFGIGTVIPASAANKPAGKTMMSGGFFGWFKKLFHKKTV